MKNITTKIILSAIVFLSAIGLVGTANATGASLYVSPASLEKTAGSIFSASVGVNTSGSKVCAVEGTLTFSNLTCQSITVASDVMAQSTPTCSNPYFLIGIPNCATSDKTLLTVSTKAGSAGTASLNIAGVDVIGEGASVGSTSTSGNYTINAIPTPTPTPTPIPTPKPTQQVAEPTEQTTEEVTPAEVQEIETPVEEIASEDNIPSGVGAAAGLQASLVNASPTRTIAIVLIVLLVISIIIGVFYMKKKQKKLKK